MSPKTKLLIHSSRILLPNGDFLVGDVEIDRGKIVNVAPEIAATDSTTICCLE
jgi:dihydroorotase